MLKNTYIDEIEPLYAFHSRSDLDVLIKTDEIIQCFSTA
jgi:hypothetical protein